MYKENGGLFWPPNIFTIPQDRSFCQAWKYGICVLHKNKCLYLENIPSCKTEIPVLYFSYKERCLSGQFKKQKLSRSL